VISDAEAPCSEHKQRSRDETSPLLTSSPDVGLTGTGRARVPRLHRARAVMTRACALSATGYKSRPSEETDADLIRQVRTGDRDAFATLHARYRAVVHRFACRMSGSETLAEDITQETFLTLTRGALNYDARQARFSTYLYGMVRHLTTRRLRQERSFVILSGGEEERWRAHEPLIEDSMVEAALRRRTIGRVRQAILTLPPRYRAVLVLCDLQGRDYATTAALVGCAIGTVRSRLHRARELLRRKLARRGSFKELPRKTAHTRGSHGQVAASSSHSPG
jgi:RNA polymerase sigma-70 factor (ECF subfamily)